MVKEKALSHRIQISQELAGLPATIRADERKLKQIVYNLLSNASKFTPENGEIHLAACRLTAANGHVVTSHGKRIDLPIHQDPGPQDASEFVEVVVRDTGIGIAQDDLERVFKPFEQADNSSSRNFQGTGLGLSLTRRMVEIHGGQIWAESQGAGRGSQFWFVLPT